MNPPNAILHELLNLAEIMLTNGAEVSRVEETLNRMGRAYGATQMNVFAITSSIVVTMVFEEGEEYTQTRRITTPVGTDFFKLEQANALSNLHPYASEAQQLLLGSLIRHKPNRFQIDLSRRHLLCGANQVFGAVAQAAIGQILNLTTCKCFRGRKRIIHFFALIIAGFSQKQRQFFDTFLNSCDVVLL